MEKFKSTPLFCTADGYEILYAVKRGDTLTGIVREQYNLFGSAAAPVVQRILENNQEIKSADLIYSGQLLVLRFPWDAPEIRTAEQDELKQTKKYWNGLEKPLQETMADLAYVDNISGILHAGGGGATGAGLLIQSNLKPMKDIVGKYEDYRAGKITRSVYGHYRSDRIKELQKRIGRPAESLLFKGKKANEALRMKPGGGPNATRPYLGQVNRLQKIAGKASKGGFVLAAAGLGLSCYEIAHTDSVVEKDKIAVEAIAGTAAGLGVGVLIGLFLVSNPIGWGTAIIIAAGTAAVGYAAGNFAGHVYHENYSDVRIVEPLMIDRVCR